MPLNNHLKEYRAKLGVNQQEMGAMVQTFRQTISQIERGDYSPSVTFIFTFLFKTDIMGFVYVCMILLVNNVSYMMRAAKLERRR